MTRLHELHEREDQSPWLDNLRRDWLQDGTLARFVSEGVRGVTSNPTIFAKAISGQDTYDAQFLDLVGSMSVEEAYWELVITDILDALDVLAPVHADSGGTDGFVSLEVSPALAHDAGATAEAALSLHRRIARPNLLVKIPATREGIPAIRRVIGGGHSVNVTLIFGQQRYAEVIEAYLSGLEDLVASGAEDLSHVASVASFFVSRVDTEVDKRLEKLGGAAAGLAGTAAVANARLAYEQFLQRFSGPRWEALAARGARVQRPLWASTSTKNPAYDDLLYVDSLIGPRTVNTLPDATIAALVDHGVVARTLDTPEAVEEAHRVEDALGDVGISLEDVAVVLENEGVASFAASFDELLAALAAKAPRST